LSVLQIPYNFNKFYYSSLAERSNPPDAGIRWVHYDSSENGDEPRWQWKTYEGEKENPVR